MADLVLKERGSYEIEIKERKRGIVNSKTLRVPFELTVIEVKRILEINAKVERMAKATIDDEDFDATLRKMEEYWGYMFSQATIILQHFQPEITTEYLQKNMTQSEVLELTNFFEVNRSYQVEKQQSTRGTAKKKWKSQIDDLNRIIGFMVYYGYAYRDLMLMYFDEFMDFHAELYFQMEMEGKVKEGTYNKVKGVDNSSKTIDDIFGKMII